MSLSDPKTNLLQTYPQMHCENSHGKLGAEILFKKNVNEGLIPGYVACLKFLTVKILIYAILQRIHVNDEMPGTGHGDTEMEVRLMRAHCSFRLHQTPSICQERVLSILAETCPA